MRPNSTDYAPYYEKYTSLVPEDDVLAAFENQLAETRRTLASIGGDLAGHRYAEGKWSVKEVIGHVIDAERVFSYRAMAIARGEQQALPGFDEGEFVRNGGFASRTLADLAEEYELLRGANLVMFRGLLEEAWDRRGTASNHPVTPRALAWIMVGHERHHLGVLRERYGVGS